MRLISPTTALMTYRMAYTHRPDNFSSWDKFIHIGERAANIISQFRFFTLETMYSAIKLYSTLNKFYHFEI